MERFFVVFNLNVTLDSNISRKLHVYMGLVVRKPVFGVSDKASFKPVFSAIETSYTCSKIIYDVFQKANNKGADQTAQMRAIG